MVGHTTFKDKEMGTNQKLPTMPMTAVPTPHEALLSDYLPDKESDEG